jgi:hypothetical protein
VNAYWQLLPKKTMKISRDKMEAVFKMTVLSEKYHENLTALEGVYVH